MKTPWKVKTVCGTAGGFGNHAEVTLLIQTDSPTLEEVRSKVEALPDFLDALSYYSTGNTDNGKWAKQIVSKFTP